MSAIYDFYGKNVTEAIENARQELGVEHEQLDIDIVTTGSAGIFGFAKKDAHIRVVVKQQPKEDVHDPYGVSDIFADSLDTDKTNEKSREKKPAASPRAKSDSVTQPVVSAAKDQIAEKELQAAEVELLEKELVEIVRLMGFTAAVTTTVSGRNIEFVLQSSEHEAELTGEEGRVLDSLQYLLRKIAGRKVDGSVRLNLDVGDYRARRLAEMKVLATELAEQVRQDGKTQAIPALSPAERREIHILLQGDDEIRSRSVGDGIFKKVLIYKPGSGRRGRRSPRNRKSA
ncbi:MAG: RNA-binding protein [Desulfobacterales bacterium]|nr:MAG: RNA-binding protein [Desulfobacterales bacterium]